MVVDEIWRYPVKSMGGERLTAVEVSELGIEFDRRWGVLDVATGNVLTGRRAPKLLMATATVTDGALRIDTGDGTIDGSAATAGDELSDWLGQPVQLVTAGDSEGGTYEVPLDIDNETDWASWTGPAGALHDSSRTRVSMVSTGTLGRHDRRRFRANLVLDGAADAEDAWVGETVMVGDAVRLDVQKHIDRCIMVARAQPDLPSDLGTLKTIINERNNLLGVGALVIAGGRVGVGDEVVPS